MIEITKNDIGDVIIHVPCCEREFLKRALDQLEDSRIRFGIFLSSAEKLFLEDLRCKLTQTGGCLYGE